MDFTCKNIEPGDKKEKKHQTAQEIAKKILEKEYRRNNEVMERKSEEET